MLPDPNSALSVGWLLLVISSLGGAISGLVALVRWLWPKTEKREVTMSPEHVGRAEFDRLRGDVDGLTSKLDALKSQAANDTKEIMHAGEARAVALHERCRSIETEIRQLPSQIIALIHRTKDL